MVLGLEPVAPRGDLGGIFVKIPPKTSKNVSFGNSGFVGKESAEGFGQAESLGRLFWLVSSLICPSRRKGYLGDAKCGLVGGGRFFSPREVDG